MRTVSFTIPRANDKSKLKDTARNTDFLRAPDCRKRTNKWSMDNQASK